MGLPESFYYAAVVFKDTNHKPGTTVLGAKHNKNTVTDLFKLERTIYDHLTWIFCIIQMTEFYLVISVSSPTICGLIGAYILGRHPVFI